MKVRNASTLNDVKFKDEYYKQKFLQKGSRTSENYLEECTYRVDLKQLYQVKSTCYHHQVMPYCPVQLKIMPDIQKYFDGAAFLLQVWNYDGRKILEKPLYQEIKIWNVFYEHFIYKPEALDENDDCFHMHNLKNGSLYLIEDFVKDPSFKYLGYTEGTFYIANHREIKLIQLNDTLGQGETKRITVKPHEISSIMTDNLRIHGLYLNKFGYIDGNLLLVAIETLDSQIDFNQLAIIKKPGEEGFDYQLKQLRQIFPRNIHHDPITKFLPIWQGIGFNYCVAVRESRNFDMYFNAQKFYSSDEDNVSLIDADISFDNVYLRMGKDEVKQIDLKHRDRVNLENAEIDTKVNFNTIFHQRIKGHCKIYRGFILVRTFMLVSHGHILSQYRILKTINQWINHLAFHCDIENIFRLQVDEQLILLKDGTKVEANTVENKDDLIKEGGKLVDEKQEYLYVLLKDGTIKLLKTFIIHEGTTEKDNPSGQRIGTEIVIVDKDFKMELKGTQVIQFSHDKQNNKYAFFLTKDKEGQVFLEALHQNSLTDFSTQIPSISGDAVVTCIFSQDKRQQLAIWLKQQIKNEEINKVDTVNDLTVYDISISKDKTLSAQILSKLALGSTVLPRMHACISSKSSQDLLVLDQRNIYKLNFNTKEVIIFKDQNCEGLYFADKNYCYALSSKSEKFDKSGLRLYDFDSFIDKNQDLSFLLTQSMVGCQGNIDFSNDNQRIAFLASFDSIEVLPLMHRNAISFIGMQERSTYIATKVDKDRFIALNNNNVLTTWNILTGKLIMEWELKDGSNPQDYSRYETFQFRDDDLVYRKQWYNKILIKSKDPVKGIVEEQFFDPDKIQTPLEKQVSFVKKIKKEFFEFKVIEILSVHEVKEHCTFTHPTFNGSIQFMYFSENLEYMYEQLVIYRFFLYKKVPLNDGTNRVTWQHIHTFTSFPNDPLDFTQYPLQFSPDFTKYVDIDRQKRTYMIRDSITQKMLSHIPETLMSAKSEDLRYVYNRFQWVDNETFKIVSHDGIERLISISDNSKQFKEIAFNVIPMYDKELATKHHIVTDLPSVDEGDILPRLVRKYQVYKSTFYMKKQEGSNYMQEQLFTVDYGINNCQSKYVSDLSFTFLHWKLIEQLEIGKLHIESIGNSQIQLLCYNILPGGDTLLHKLCQKGDLIEKVYQISHPHLDDKSKLKFHIPFLQNLDNISPMKLLSGLKDYRTIDVLLKYLSSYGIDHHSRAMIDQLPIMIKHDLPSLLGYIDSRLLQTEQVKNMKRGLIQNGNKAHGVVAASYSYEQQEIDQLILRGKNEMEVNLEFVDMPELLSYNSELSQKFFDTLEQTEKMEIFQKKAIKMVIEFKWPLVRKYTIKKLFIPFIIFQFLYLIYMNMIYYWKDGFYNPQTRVNDNEGIMSIVNVIFEIVLAIYSSYFIMNEYTQFKKEGKVYLQSFWNYIDLVPQFLLIIFVIFSNLGVFTKDSQILEGSMQATMSLFIWFKFLYFLRIFEKTGYLIRIILSVGDEMKFFLMILLCTMTAFGDSMYQLSSSNSDGGFIDGGFVGGISYVYRMVLGDFSTADFGEVAVPYVWLLFILCTVFNMIIMLNLLIAIISQVFIKVNSVSVEASYQEKASIIAENSYLIPQEEKDAFCGDNKYLLLACDVVQELTQHNDPIENQVNSLKESISSMEKHLVKKFNKLQTKTIEEIKNDHKEAIKRMDDKYQSSFDQLKNDNQAIKEMLNQLVNKQ